MPATSHPGQKFAETSKPRAVDAPISAVNAGERRVLVRCNKSSIALPVNPTTRAQDLLNSASLLMSETIDPETAVLIESFTQLGLERPIRRYEHIRDILNSWDNDGQNVFDVKTSSDRQEGLLKTNGVPKREPKDASFTIYYSQKPGTLNKHFIVLGENGHMTVSKKEGDRNATTIHLSDFDIYSLTRKQMRKVKCPKKICFAVKSQQKSTMFLDTAALNFVHFVSTSDRELGDRFYLAIQSWRSWYLVNKFGLAQTTPAKPANTTEDIQMPGTTSSLHTNSYQPGSFQPQLESDFGQSNLDQNTQIPPKTRNLHRRNMPSRDRKAPPSAFPTQRMEETVATPRRAPSIKGRTGSTEGSIENSTNLTRNTSLRRGNSTRQKPQPLVDLTPRFKEAPQHSRIGKGVNAPDGQPLINLANDIPQEPGAIVVPLANDLRRPETRSPIRDTENDEHAFSAKGLLGRTLSKRTQGASRTGQGVKGVDGKPFIDISLKSKFADGSLLRQVEAWSGQDECGLVVDREKRIEQSTKVGEGY